MHPMGVGYSKIQNSCFTDQDVRSWIRFGKHADWLGEFDVNEFIIANDHDTDVADLYYPPALKSSEITNENVKYECEPDRYTIGIIVKRDYLNALWNIVFCSFVIQVLCFLAWGFPPTDLGERNKVVLTLMLTIVAFKYMVQDRLPAVPYTTLMDKYILACFAFLGTLGMLLLVTKMNTDVKFSIDENGNRVDLDAKLSLWGLLEATVRTKVATADIVIFFVTCLWVFVVPFVFIFIGWRAQKRTMDLWEQINRKAEQVSNVLYNLHGYLKLINSLIN